MKLDQIAKQGTLEQMDQTINSILAYRNAKLLGIQVNALYNYQDNDGKMYLVTKDVDDNYFVLALLRTYNVVNGAVVTDDSKYLHCVGNEVLTENITPFTLEVEEVAKEGTLEGMDEAIYAILAYRNAKLLGITVDYLYNYQDHNGKWYLVTKKEDGNYCVLVQLRIYGVVDGEVFTDDAKYWQNVGGEVGADQKQYIRPFQPVHLWFKATVYQPCVNIRNLRDDN